MYTDSYIAVYIGRYIAVYIDSYIANISFLRLGLGVTEVAQTCVHLVHKPHGWPTWTRIMSSFPIHATFGRAKGRTQAVGSIQAAPWLRSKRKGPSPTRHCLAARRLQPP